MKKQLFKYYPEITGLLVFITYMFTISHSVGENDSGELAMAQATLSIPHPTGYPLFVLIGYLFNKIPLPFSVIFKLNLLSAIWCTLTVIMVIRISSLILENFHLLLSSKGRTLSGIQSIKNSEIITASVFSGLMLAYSATFWLQSTRVEVYSLQIFLTSVIIFLTLRNFINHKKDFKEEAEPVGILIKKWWVLFVFIGFGFANHLMTLYLLPAAILMFFFSAGFNKNSIKTFPILILVSVSVSALFYIGLMFRAKMDPVWSFGDPSTIKSLLGHISASEYSKHLLGFDSLREQGTALLKILSFNFSGGNFSTGEFSLSILFGITGLLFLFLFRKEFSWYLVLIIIVSVSLALSYRIPDINEYFLVPFLILSVLSAIPIIFILKIINNKKAPKFIFYTFLILLGTVQFTINYKYADRSDANVFEDFYKASVTGLPPNSILITDRWSIFISPGLYYREVENFRKDISVISPYGLFFYDWYRKKQKINILDDDNTIVKRDNLFIAYDVVSNLISKRIISLPAGSVLVPHNYFFSLEFDDSYYPLNDKEPEMRLGEKPFGEFDSYFYFLIPFMAEQRILYELSYNKIDKASYYYKKIRSTFRNYTISEITIVALNRNGIITN